MYRLRVCAVVTRPDDNGPFVAYVPAIPGCHTLGKTPEEANSELVAAVDMMVEE